MSISADGTASTWLLEGGRFLRQQQMLKHKNFLGVSHLPPDCAQIVICGSDRMVTYYDALEHTHLRGSKHHASDIQFSLRKRFPFSAPLLLPSFPILLLCAESVSN
jgi:hypothetical protein